MCSYDLAPYSVSWTQSHLWKSWIFPQMKETPILPHRLHGRDDPFWILSPPSARYCLSKKVAFFASPWRTSNLAHLCPTLSPGKALAATLHSSMIACGEENCPLSDGSFTARKRVVELDFDFETIESHGQHMRVDHHTFRHPEYVLVKLSALGLDCSLWGDIEHFRGLV